MTPKQRMVKMWLYTTITVMGALFLGAAIEGMNHVRNPGQ